MSSQLPMGNLYEVQKKWEQDASSPIGSRWEKIEKPNSEQRAAALHVRKLSTHLAAKRTRFTETELRRLKVPALTERTVVKASKALDSELFRPTRAYKLISKEVFGGIAPLAVVHAKYAGGTVFSCDKDMHLKFMGTEPACRRRPPTSAGIRKAQQGAWYSQQLIQHKFPYMVLGMDWIAPRNLPRIEYKLQKGEAVDRAKKLETDRTQEALLVDAALASAQRVVRTQIFQL